LRLVSVNSSPRRVCPSSERLRNRDVDRQGAHVEGDGHNCVSWVPAPPRRPPRPPLRRPRRESGRSAWLRGSTPRPGSFGPAPPASQGDSASRWTRGMSGSIGQYGLLVLASRRGCTRTGEGARWRLIVPRGRSCYQFEAQLGHSTLVVTDRYVRSLARGDVILLRCNSEMGVPP
jgi:hypothetical protein